MGRPRARKARWDTQGQAVFPLQVGENPQESAFYVQPLQLCFFLFLLCSPSPPPFFHTTHLLVAADSHPSGASFVKQKKANAGKSFPQALEERYGEEEAASTVEVNMRQRIDLELVGEEEVKSRIQQHDQLSEAQLRDMDINDTIEDTLATKCPGISTLDISFNLISKWSTVERICQQLPNLTSLNVSGNRMLFDHLSATAHSSHVSPFPNVTKLYISHIPGLTWDQVCPPVLLTKGYSFMASK